MSTNTEEATPADAPETLRCRTCSVESTWTDGYVARSNVIHGPHHVCVTCFLYRQKYRNYYWSWLWWTAFTIGAGSVLSDSFPEAVLFAASFYVLLYMAIVVHELGHLLAARAVGVHVPVVSFGGGLRTKVLRFGSTFLILSPTPSEGLIVPAYSSPEHFRKKAFAILLGGPLLNTLAALAGLMLHTAMQDNLTDAAGMALYFWIATNGFMAIANLWPFTENTPFGERQSDGLQIWRLFRKTDGEVDDVVEQHSLVLASLEYHLGCHEKALAILETVIERSDDSAVAQSLITATLAETDQLVRGIVLSRRYLESPDLNPMERSILQNNLAYMLYLSGDQSKLAEADELSAGAIEVLPMMLGVRSTRACILIAMGRFEEGVDLLSDERFRLETPGHQATVKSMLAKALAHLGQRERALRSLDAARKLDPASRHLAAAEATVAATAEA